MKSSTSLVAPRFLRLAGALLVTCFATASVSAAEGDLDPSFDPGAGASGTVLTSALQSDGKILIGGGFVNYGGVLRLRIARVNPNGSLDTTFDPGSGASGGFVNAVVVQVDGKILIGGGFTSYNGVPRSRIARLNADGSLDPSFNPGTGADGLLRVVALQSDGKILIGGSLQNYNGVSRLGLARLNVDGSLDTSFNPGTGVGTNFRQVLAVAVQPDGRIVIGGNFDGFNGTARQGIARVNADGSLDASFNPGTGAQQGGNTTGDVSAVALRGSSILIGGFFTSYNGVARGSIAQLNADGSLDTAFAAGGGALGGSGATASVAVVRVLADSKILIAGTIASYNGTPRNGLARLNADGSLDTPFDPATAAPDNGGVQAVSVQADGNIIIGGSFTSYDSIPRLRLARVLLTAAEPPPPPPPPVVLDLWSAGRDLVANEKPDRPEEANAMNQTVPQWSYGHRATVEGTQFTLFAPATHTNADFDRETVEGWRSESGIVFVNTGTEPATYFAGTRQLRSLFPSQIYVAPATSLALPVVRWVAPADHSYRILAKWFDLDDTGGNGASAHVLINGRQVFGRKENNAFIGLEWNDGGNAAMPAETFILRAGDVVDFVLNSRGDARADATVFNAVIAKVPTLSITTPVPGVDGAATFVEGQDVAVSVAIDPNHPVEAVKLFLNGQGAPVPLDTAAPYDFTLRNLDSGTYYLTAVAEDEDGIEAVTRQVKIVVNKTATAAAIAQRADGKQPPSGKTVSTALAGGITYRCTQSGPWQDRATWGGLGVPGRNDDAIVPRGFEVALADSVEIDNLEAAGRIVVASNIVFPSLRVHGVLQASNYIGGAGSLSLFIAQGGQFVNVAGQTFLDGVTCTIDGEAILGENGTIAGRRGVLFNDGTTTVLSAPGTNRPTVASLLDLNVQGGLVTVGRNAQMHVSGNALVAAGGLNLIGQDGGSLISEAGSGLIGQDGGSLVGHDGSSLVGHDGSSLIGLDGSSLIGQDGSSLIGQDGGSLVGAGAGNAPTLAKGLAPQGSSTGIVLNGGTITGSGNLIGDVVNRGAFISPGNSAGTISISGNYTQEAAGTLVLEVGGTGTSPLQYDELQISGSATLGGNLIVRTINGFTPQAGDNFPLLTYAAASGSFGSVSSNAQISFGPNGATAQVSGPNPPAPKALNISTRMRVETGDNVLIAGFIVTGSQPKKVIIRGLGPSLPVAGALADPILELDGGAITNDSWRSTQESEIIATTIPPSSDLEAAIVATLAPGGHTAILRGKNNGTGVGLVEVYDLEPNAPAQLANISTRGLVQTGDDVMIGGFIVGGTYPAKVVVRAIGPSLSQQGVSGALQDTTLELVDSQGNILSNDDWRSTQESEIIATTVPPTNEKEAAIVATLVPGNYTAIVRGKNGTTGIALVEGFNIQ